MTRHSLSRRAVLLAAATLPHTLARSGTQSVELRNQMEELAREHGICAATFATITAGTPDLPELVVGCKSIDGVSASSIFQAASLSKPVLVRDESALRLTTAAPVSASARPRLDWGLGWGIEHLPSGPCIWQWGNNTGYRAFAMASVRSGDGFVLFTNSERGLLLAEPLANLVIPSEHPSFQFRMLR